MPTPFYSDNQVDIELVKDTDRFNSLADIPSWVVDINLAGEVRSASLIVSLKEGHTIGHPDIPVVAQHIIQEVNAKFAEMDAVIVDMSGRAGSLAARRLAAALRSNLDFSDSRSQIEDVRSVNIALLRLRPDTYLRVQRRQGRPILREREMSKGLVTINGERGVFFLDADCYTLGRLGNHTTLANEITAAFKDAFPTMSISDIEFYDTANHADSTELFKMIKKD